MAIVSKKLKTICDDDKPIFKRLFAEFSPVNFNQELHDRLNDFLLQNLTINENNFDQLFIKFHSIITQAIGKHASLKKLTKYQERLHRRPWTTKGILMFIKCKQRMHKTHYTKGSTLGNYLYKEYSNLQTRVEKLDKKKYFYRKIEEHKNSLKKTWDVLCNLLPNISLSHVPNSIIVDENNISDPNIIVNKFNAHFANTGKVLASRLNCSDNNAFLSYLKLPCPFSAYLYPASL